MRSLITLLAVIGLAAACAPPDGDDTDTDTDTAVAGDATADESAPSTPSGLIQNTPEGGVLDWVSDIDAGLDSVPELVGSDPSAAQGAVLNLYVMRQEYLEMYYGPGGRLEATPELAAAIDGNENRFHALMTELAKEAPDSGTVVALTDSLAAQTGRVRAAAEAVGRELSPWPEEGR